MRTGRVSKTALKLALITTIVSDRKDWDEPLPDGAGALSERLLLAADQPMYRAGTIRLMKSWLGRLSTNKHAWKGWSPQMLINDHIHSAYLCYCLA